MATVFSASMLRIQTAAAQVSSAKPLVGHCRGDARRGPAAVCETEEAVPLHHAN